MYKKIIYIYYNSNRFDSVFKSAVLQYKWAESVQGL